MSLSQIDFALAVGPGIDKGWYAVQTRSNFEHRIARALVAKGTTTYLPVVRELHQWKDRKKVVDVPVFSSYLFVRIYDSAEEQLRVLQTSGVVRILGSSKEIERIPDWEIESMRILVNSGAALLAHPFLKEGTHIRVKRGPLAGVEGVLVKVKSAHRVVVSIPLLSQSVAAEIDVHSVEVKGPGC